MKYIDAQKLTSEIDKKWKELADKNVKVGGGKYDIEISTYLSIKNLITRLQQDKPELDLDYLKNKAELIANGIMIGVQANKYHTCIYDKASNDFNHSHLVRAALKGIEFGLNAEKEE